MQEVSLMPWWWPIFVNLWAVIGAPVGIFIGAYLTRRWQRKQWIADQRVKEWSELIGTLSNALMRTHCHSDKASAQLKEEQWKENIEARRNAAYVLLSRVFIAKEVEEMNLRERWTDLVQAYDKHRDPGKVGTGFQALLQDLRKKSEKDLGG